MFKELLRNETNHVCFWVSLQHRMSEMREQALPAPILGNEEWMSENHRLQRTAGPMLRYMPTLC